MKTRLRIEHLEDRLAPANLTLAAFTLVDGDNAALANPVYGQKLFFKASWTGLAMAAAGSVPVRITANGIPLDYAANYAAGSSGGIVYPNGWFIGTSAITVTATVDPDNLVAETNENDNTMTMLVTPVAPTSLTMKFVQPLGRTPFVDWAINNYADVDPRPGIAVDAMGGPYQYDGHDAIDAHPYGQDGMDEGFPIYAMADGVVTFRQDGKFDREIYNYSSDGNYLFLEHANGWGSAYFHLARHTLTVQSGETVKAGQVIALMGSSGYSSVAHIHVTPTYRDAPVETLFAPDVYMLDPIPYAGTVAPFVWDAFLTNSEPTYYDVQERETRVQTVSTAQTGNLYFTALTYNVRTPAQTATMAWKWYRPDGSLENTWPATYQAADNSRYGYWYWYRPANNFAGHTGIWNFAFELDGIEQKRVPFTVNAAGAPTMRFSTEFPNTGDGIIIDERTTPIDYGQISSGSAGLIKTYTIQNHGSATLSLSNYTLPAGFSIVGSPPTSVPAGGTTTLEIRLDSSPVGRKFGRVGIQTNDPTVPELNFNVEGTVSGSLPAGSPVLTLTDASLGYNHKSLPRRFAPNATLTDSDSAHFNGGNLVAKIEGRKDGLELLGIRNEGTGVGQIGVSGANVRYGGTLIGTFTTGQTLTVNLNSSATPAAVQALVRNLTYAHTGSTPSYFRRYISLRVTDNTAKTSDLRLANVSPSGVERAPTIVTLANASTATGTPFVRNGSFTDSFGNSWTATVDYGDGLGSQTLTLNPDKTFSLTRSYATAGDRTVTVTIISDTGGISTSSFTVSVVVPPTVSGYSVNGAAPQRSRISTIAVSFANPVDAASLQTLGAITLNRTSAPGGVPLGELVRTGATGANGRIVVAPASGMVSSITLTFDNANGVPVTAGVENGSLADGRWRLAIPSLSYTSTLDDPNLRRLFGDADANGTVDAADFSTFGGAFGQTVSNSPFDFGANGTIDGNDFAAFGARFGITL